MSLISSGVVGFTCARPGCRWVHPGSLGSQAGALGVVRYIWGRSVHLHALCGSLGSSGVVGFTSVRPRGRWFHPGSSGPLVRAMGVVGFTCSRRWGR